MAGWLGLKGLFSNDDDREFDAISGPGPISSIPPVTPSSGPIQQAVSPPQGTPPRPQSAPAVTTPTPQAQTDTGPAGSAAAPKLPTPPKEEVDQMVERAKSASPEVKKKIGADKFDFGKAFDQWTEKFGGLVDPNAKLTKEEKGLFLMEFGMRMMAAAQDNSAMAAAGMAGVPVVQQLQQRRAQKTAQNQGVLQGAMKGMEAEGLMRRAQMDESIQQQRLELEREKMGRISGNDVIWTDKGGVTIGPDGTPTFLKDEQGNPLRPGLTPGAGTRDYAQQWLYRQLIDVGDLSEQEAIQVVAGAMTPLEVDQRAGDLAEKEFAAMMKDGRRLPPPGSTENKRLTLWTKAEKEAYIAQLKQQKLRTMSQLAIGQPTGGRSGNDELGLFPEEQGQ